MQLKGLVKFFTIALIVFSLYQLSFTWFVNRHEKKMEEKARKSIAQNYPSPETKYPGDPALQALYKDTLEQLYQDRLARLLDSTREETVTYGIQGPISYEVAKESELALGLDLQGGMSVTLEVSLEGVIRSMANNTQDPIFEKAIQNANARKANSDAHYINLFVDEYKKLAPDAKLANLFANPNNKDIKISSSDDEVIKAIRKGADEAFENTYKVLQNRINQFGVSQPNINPDRAKDIITVELAGVKDPERVRKYLQSSANLQFWEVYNIQELDVALSEGQKALSAYLKGQQNATAAPAGTTDSTAAAQSANPENLSDLLAAKADEAKDDSAAQANPELDAPLAAHIQFIPPTDRNQDGKPEFAGALGYVAISDTALVRSYLENPVVRSKFPVNLKFLYGIPEKDDKGKKLKALPLYAIKTVPGQTKARLEGEAIEEARQDVDPMTSAVVVSMSMNKPGARIWADMTTRNKDRAIAIVLDDLVYSAPNVNQPILNGNSQITGNYTAAEAQDLANILKSGKLDAPAKIVQEQIVGPTLGAESISDGFNSIVVAFITIFVLMLIYYNTSGWVANISLTLNLLFTVGVLSSMHATLTLPGIAGLVLGIGMAVDAHVLIFERIKEELALGKDHKQAIADGYRRSNAPVLDGHIAQLITAAILFIFGLGPVLGFATTQLLSISISLFCGILVSRLIKEIWVARGKHFKYFTAASKAVFHKASFDFMRIRKVSYVILAVVVLGGIGSLFNGFDYGVEFSGGRSYTVKFDKKFDVIEMREKLHPFLGEYPVVKTIGTQNNINITTTYLIHEQGDAVEEQVLTKLQEALTESGYVPATVSKQDFATKYVQSSQTVQPSISKDLVNGAKWATIISLLAISAYILLRFRKWQYSLGTFVSLVFNIASTLAVFSFFRDLVPFALEIDQHFIAAVLTVVGFSMNDTIIVFDRVREYFRKNPTENKYSLVNRSINDTLPRTVMTSLTLLLVVIVLYVVGGEVTRGFAFAMLIGIITGTFSSIFVAGAVLVDMAKGDTLQDPVKPTVEKKPASALQS